ncbi:Tex family protein [Aphanothece sacrum]|uniref:RNA binding S1 domain protein n=1 Tax=Aphanothece sacrum FPU1 TaxID=1920663 RepID=A0A401IMF6_APHSA|nr:Tex family protein [Aphanothece sacrum]GBF82408.1 RNA binding S1 domain protein [Aphanothece sacrum FPU1]GBF84437.1 RNA binding S1 domain protein [Aphanothece sacrum FPU3]
MVNFITLIASELSLTSQQIKNALDLLIEGATIPFIARYRKEKTGSLDEIQIRDIWERYNYLMELEKRKQTILESINAQNKLTDEVRNQIETCLQKNELEDLYLPYKPKRRTKATVAKEKGLEPLASLIKSLNNPTTTTLSLEQEASQYISEENGIITVQDALNGAADILAEETADKANLRAYLREYFMKEGVFISRIKNEHPEGSTKYEMYRDFRIGVQKIASHNILALFRGEEEKIISLDIEFDESFVLSYLASQEIKTKNSQIKAVYQEMLKDSFNRLIKPSLLREVRSDRKNWADIESIKTFETNLRELLLSSPAGMKPTLAIDPGFRTGCKVSILSETGQFLEYQAIFPHTGEGKRKEAEKILTNLIQKYKIQLIAIGNGTASRETDQFVSEVMKPLENKPIQVIVNESGASIYSASDVAREEFPDLDITIRGAISIGRRLQDPLAELVKIDPKSIGVGQYQHDVDQKLLKKKLEETIESCVNYVGVDLNTASQQLLTFVSGITPTIANNIVNYRNQNGVFKNRKELLKVAKLGAKSFEQAAGFLRIRGGNNPLDNTAVHPESYPVVEAIAKTLNISLNQISEANSPLKSLDLNLFVTDKIGLPTLKDLITELEKPGRDPREEFKYATFKEGVTEISDLREGMILEGIITNVVNFGAFVDIGVHQDGLVHISQLANYFIKDPKQVVKVGQVVKVKVLEVNEQLKRINLSIKDALQ